MKFKTYLKNREFIEDTEMHWKKQGFTHGVFFGLGEEIYHGIGQGNPLTDEEIENYKKEIVQDPEFGVSEEIMQNTWIIKI